MGHPKNKKKVHFHIVKMAFVGPGGNGLTTSWKEEGHRATTTSTKKE